MIDIEFDTKMPYRILYTNSKCIEAYTFCLGLSIIGTFPVLCTCTYCFECLASYRFDGTMHTEVVQVNVIMSITVIDVGRLH